VGIDPMSGGRAADRAPCDAPQTVRQVAPAPGLRVVCNDHAPDREHPDLTVVICCRNGAATLRETLEGLARQAWDRPWEIVLADNGSTDGSVEVFRAFARAHPRLTMRILDASARRGQQHAMNLGVAAARAPAVVFCDADDVPGEGWLAAMGAALAVHPLVACRIDFERLNRGWVTESRGTHQTRRLEELPFLPGLAHAGGGTIGVQRALVERIGGFDPDFRYHMDTEFCVRAQLADCPLHFVPEVAMHVRARDALGPLFRQSYNWARYEMKLVHRCRAHVDFAGGWREYVRSWQRLIRHHLRPGLRPRPETMLSAAWLRAGIGRLAGQFTGMLRHRLPPYRGIGR
jgi:glycosyltransferase involved in cell wall biosynthesis